MTHHRKECHDDPYPCRGTFSLVDDLDLALTPWAAGRCNSPARMSSDHRPIAPVVTVQNLHNIANCQDDALIDSLAAQGISYVPYFPLGGFTPLQSHVLDAVALRLEASSMAVALAWLLQRLPNILLIPGTSSLAHLYENAAGATLKLPADAVEELDSIGG